MKSSRPGDYVIDDIAKTGDTLSMHCILVVKLVLNQIWN